MEPLCRATPSRASVPQCSSCNPTGAVIGDRSRIGSLVLASLAAQFRRCGRLTRSVVAIDAINLFELWTPVDAMTLEACLLRSALQHVARVRVSMTVGGVHGLVVFAAEIDLEVGEEIVAGDKIGGIGKACGLRASSAQVTLATDRDDVPWVARTLRSQPSQLGLGGALGRYLAVTGIEIKGANRQRE